jgi:hypothetical protein
VRADLLDWRDQWADPAQGRLRHAGAGPGAELGVGRGLLAYNAAAGVEQLYASDRADQVWTPAELARFVAAAKSPEVASSCAWPASPACGAPTSARLAWAHVGDVAIVMPTGKSRGRKTAGDPAPGRDPRLLDEIRARQRQRHAELAQGRRQAPPRRRRSPPCSPTPAAAPGPPGGLEHQVVDAKAAAAPPIAKHLHDARGTFGTRLRRAGLTASEIADVLGWDEDRVERLLKTYVDQALV